MQVVLILPTLKINGGNREAINFSSNITPSNGICKILVFWLSSNELLGMPNVNYFTKLSTRYFSLLISIPIIMYKFLKFIIENRNKGNIFIFTHYSTLIFSLFIPRNRCYFFVQGIEWKFLNVDILSYLLRIIIIQTYKRGKIVTTNRYLSSVMELNNLKVFVEVPIWANASFYSSETLINNIDVAMVLSKPRIKRLDLYFEFIKLAKSQNLKIAVITSEIEIYDKIVGIVDKILLSPNIQEMKNLYSQSKCFLHLSESEAF